MKEILPDLNQWSANNKTPIAVATVIKTWGSAPRKAGAKMALKAGGEMSGSVSGGCVEGAVFEAGLEVLQTSRPQLLHFGVADETAWEVGLACGGHIQIFVALLDTAVSQFIQHHIAANKRVDILTIIRAPQEMLGKSIVIGETESYGSLGSELNTLAKAEVSNANHVRTVQVSEGIEIFIDPILPAPKLIMVGGVHIAIGLTSMAKTLGYRTIVIDPRRAFGSQARFPHVDQLIQAWPKKAFEQVEVDGGTAVALLTHDPKIDDPALEILLHSPAFYIGALGSRNTHAKRIRRLQAMDFRAEQISRIHAPIGLNIGASTPEEIALSVMAEITQTRLLDPKG